MATVKRIAPGSAFKVGLVVYAILGLIVGICMALFSMMAGSLGSLTGGGVPGARALGFGFGLGAIILFPILYGIVGASPGSSERRCTISQPAGWAGSKSISARLISVRIPVLPARPVCIF